MGKFTKIVFIFGILLMLSLGVMAAIVLPTRSDVIWTTKASNISTNNSVILESDTYIIGGSYTFRYFEEKTMVITVNITAIDTAEEHVIVLSISPQSSNIETLTDGESFYSTNGNHTIAYSCNSAEFSSTSCNLYIIDPGLFRDTTNPVGAKRDATEQKWETAFEYSIPACLLGVLICFISGLFLLSERRVKPTITTSSVQYPTDSPYHKDNTMIGSYSPNNEQNLQSGYWVCQYCNTINDITSNYCAICNREKET